MFHYHKPNGRWQADKVIDVDAVEVAGWPFPLPGLITDLILSLDDRFLYFSNWLHGDIRQYDVNDPANPKLTGRVWLGGLLGKAPDVRRELAGGPQMLQLSLDGKRLYVTSSLYSCAGRLVHPCLDPGTLPTRLLENQAGWSKRPAHLALEVLLQRQQLRIALRTAPAAPRLSRWEQVTLAALGARYRDLATVLVLVQPATVLRWHRAIVRRKWTYGTTPKRGRPATPAATVDLIVRFARENRAWGYGKLQGELLEVGHRVSRATIKRVLRRQGLPPAPRRGRTTWRAFLAQHREQLLACDCFTVDTLCLQRLYVLLFIALGSRRLHRAGCTAHPTAARVTQQARQRTWQLQEAEGAPRRFLLRDRDGTSPASFETVFAGQGLTVVKTPPRTPNANAAAERVVRSLRAECPDRVRIVNQGHLRSVLAQYAAYDNHRRPHQGRGQAPPVPLAAAPAVPAVPAQIRCRPVLGGLISDDDIAA